MDKKKTKRNLSNWEILKYAPILALVYLSFSGNIMISFVEPILPNYWMKLTDNNWDTLRSGILFAFSPLTHALFFPFIGKYGYKIGRHNVILIGMILLSSTTLIILPSGKLVYLSIIFLLIMGVGSGAVDASLQPMFAQAYDNLLEREKLKKMNYSSQQGLNSIDKTEDDTSTIENDVKLIVLPSNEKETDITNSKESNIERIIISDGEDTVEEEKEGFKNRKENKEENEEEEEDAHNKYTRVFSLGNMAMNIAFIIGPTISSLIVASIGGENPSVNRFKSSFFRCCLIFTVFGCLSSLVAIIPGMKRYQNIKKMKN